jgi:hypothetical protein
MSSMIYEPELLVNLVDEFGGAIVQAFRALGVDFVAGENKAWEFYVGEALGYAAAATGIPGAGAALYFVGDAIDLVFLHSPDGGSVRLVLDGILQAQIDTVLPELSWIEFGLALARDGLHRLEIWNDAGTNPSHPTWAWLGLGAISISGMNPVGKDSVRMAAVTTLSVRILDESGTPATLLLRLPATFTHAQVTAFAANFAPIADAVLAGKIDEMSVTYSLTLPQGLKASADANSDVQKSALFTLAAANTSFSDGIRVPAFKEAKFSGDSVNLEDSAVSAFVDALTDGLDGGGTPVLPCDRYGNDLTSLNKAKKTFRKA